MSINEVLAKDWVLRGALLPDVHRGYSLPVTFVPKADTIIPKDSIIKILTRQQ